MDPLGFEKELERRRIFPLYFLGGEETYLVEEARKRIESVCLEPGTRDFNYDLFEGGESQPEKILDAAKTLPMMAPWRVVVVKDAHLFTADQVKPLISYFENPSPRTCLILTGRVAGPWKGYLKVLERKGRVVSFSHPRGGLLTRYMARRATELGKEISPEAAVMIQQLAGNDLGEIYQELDKAAFYAGEGRRIEADHVEAVISPLGTHTVFDLTRAVGMRNCEEALTILKEMLESGEPHLKILGMIVRQFRLIWKAREMRSLGMRDREIGRAVGVPDFSLRKFLAQLNSFTPGELEECYGRLFESHVAFKTRSTSKQTILEGLVISLCC
ncbi:MAG: DNA polymerase III subunit delta [Deltaproteobacteria bacterium]|nr:DNA polymerase III subunit delta [Deltaproteobacteria bacterium]MBW2120596.1 DNA polymerase III subunit delta [Deltaproteobacteria bacterium]